MGSLAIIGKYEGSNAQVITVKGRALPAAPGLLASIAAQEIRPGDRVQVRLNALGMVTSIRLLSKKGKNDGR